MMNTKNGSIHNYDDIIHLQHPDSPSHPRMPLRERAAQFSPFAALSGHREALQETARLTDEKIQLDEHAKTILNQKLQQLLAYTADPPEAVITYFEKDLKKQGGCYKTITGTVVKFDTDKHTVVMRNHLEIPADDIIAIESDIM